MVVPERLLPTLDGLPAKPGCYLMKSADGTVIYVGKAINLRSRVRSYFQPAADHGRKVPSWSAARGGHRVDRRRVRARGADPRDEPDQAPPAEVQRAPEGRQALPLHPGALGGAVSRRWSSPAAWSRMAAATSGRTPASGRCTRRWTSLRRMFPYLTCDRVITGQDRARLPVRRHQAVPGAVHRRRRPGRLSADDRRPMPLPAGRDRRRWWRGCATR